MHQLRKPMRVFETTHPLAVGFLLFDAYGDFSVNRLVPYWNVDWHVVLPLPVCFKFSQQLVTLRYVPADCERRDVLHRLVFC